MASSQNPYAAILAPFLKKSLAESQCSDAASAAALAFWSILSVYAASSVGLLSPLRRAAAEDEPRDDHATMSVAAKKNCVSVCQVQREFSLFWHCCLSVIIHSYSSRPFPAVAVGRGQQGAGE